MNNIPFPNPHDSDALNDYLDGLSAGKKVTPEDELQMTAAQVHAMALQAAASVQEQIPPKFRGGDAMQTRTYSPPISNRTRRERASHLTPSRLNAWLSGALVAALVVSIFGYAWWNGLGGPDDRNNIAWAPQTASPMTQEPLSPEAAPWIADFSVEECELQGGANYHLGTPHPVTAKPQSYAVVGPATKDDAAAVTSAYRDMRGCRNMGGALNYWSHARVNNAPRSLNDVSRQELSELEEYFGTLYPQQFMAIATDLQTDPGVQEEWDLRNEYGITGLPLPLPAKLNPEWGVELADGRIAFPATLMYSANDPAIIANGLPVEQPDSTVVMLFTFEDGAWKYDDSLLLCIVNCDYGVGSPADPVDVPWSKASDPEQCLATPITSEEYSKRLSVFPTYADRSYNIAGHANDQEASEAANLGASLLNCSLNREPLVIEALLTDLGLHHYRYTTQGSYYQSPEMAGYLRQWDVGARNILLTSMQRQPTTVIDGSLERDIPEGTTGNLATVTTDAQNIASTHSPQYSYDPESAVKLDDGRIALNATHLIELDSRAAVTYEGDLSRWHAGWILIKQTDEGWRIDELLSPSLRYMVVEANRVWWWEPRYDATPIASPESDQ